MADAGPVWIGVLAGAFSGLLTAIGGALAYRTLLAEPAEQEGDPIPVFVVYCKNCGLVVPTSLE